MVGVLVIVGVSVTVDVVVEVEVVVGVSVGQVSEIVKLSNRKFPPEAP
jgi:hypothetical protein